LRFLVESQEDLTVVGEVRKASEAASMVKHLRPEVVVMDAALLHLDGFEVIEKMRQGAPRTQIVLLILSPTQEMLWSALQAGVRGFVLREAAGKEVIPAIRTVHAGHCYLSSPMNEMLDRPGQSDLLRNPLHCLSPREREVLRLVVEGKSSAEIARLLFLSVKTVETYRCRLMAKLGVHNLAHLTKLALRYGLTAP
jgi:DNA-binding NarL/FixJ family response regulator